MPSSRARGVPGVAEAIATRDPAECARQVAAILKGGARREDVVHAAALAVATHVPRVTPPTALPVLGAALSLAPLVEDPNLPIVQACALAASERGTRLVQAAKRPRSGDEAGLGRAFLEAVLGGKAEAADASFTGLLQEGEERRFAGERLFEACAQDTAAGGHQLVFAVGCWRLTRSLEWASAADLMRPAVHFAASAHDAKSFSKVLREVGRARLDLEIAARNVGVIDAAARNTYGMALGQGPDRVVADLISGLKRGRAPEGYGGLVAATAAERLVANPDAVPAAMLALATRFVLGFSHVSSRVLALLVAARAVAAVEGAEPPRPRPIANPEGALVDLGAAVERNDADVAVGLALGLTEYFDAPDIVSVLARQAVRIDAHEDRGAALLYAAWASEFASVAAAPALASLAAVLARAKSPRGIAEAVQALKATPPSGPSAP